MKSIVPRSVPLRPNGPFSRPRQSGFFSTLKAALLAMFVWSALTAGADPSFTVSTVYPAGADHNYGVAVGDFNGDGHPDLVTVSVLSHQLFVLLNQGDGTFGSPTLFPAEDADGQLEAVAVADMNGDGALDAVAIDGIREEAVVFLGRGDGTFGLGRGFPLGSVNNRFLAIADFNEDGVPDVIVVASGSFQVPAGASLLLGNKDGTLSLKNTFSWARDSTDIVGSSVGVADFNRDGHMDIVIGDFYSPTSIFLGHGDGGFTFQAASATDSGSVRAIAVADLNGDGVPDLASIAAVRNPAGSGYFERMAVSIGRGDGTFLPTATYGQFFNSANGITVADFDGSGPDIALTGYGGYVEIFRNRGDGTFGDGTFRNPPNAFFLGGPRADNIIAADLDGDRRPDLAVSAQETAGSHAGLVILKNTTPRRLGQLVLAGPVGVELGDPFSMTVTALDQFGRAFPEYGGTVHFVSTDKSPCGQLPADYTFTATDAGTHGFDRQASLLSSGARSVTVMDSISTSVQDTHPVAVSEGLVVTTLSDGVAADGQVSLREAILRANELPRSAEKPAIIRFNLCPATDAALVLTPLSELPSVEGAIVIDGYSQPGSRANTLAVGDDSVRRIVLEGKLAGPGANGLTLEGAVEVRGLEIRGFDARGIHVNKSGGGVIRGNEIHHNLGDGIDLESGNWVVGGPLPEDRNIISGNRSAGILVHDDDPGNLGHRILGNYIGIDASDLAGVPGQSSGGIVILGSANTLVGGNTVSARNVVSGNSGPGIVVSGDSRDTVVSGNFIGPSASGVAAVGNSVGMVVSNALRTIVGGGASGTGNVISGNLSHGLVVAGGARNTEILCNLLGTIPSGKFALANGGDGIVVLDDALDTLIGGASEGAGNQISGNRGNGVRLSGGNRTQILCNSIGTGDKDGVLLGNLGYGVAVIPDPLRPGSPDGNVIGGVLPGMGNVIAYNTAGGVGAKTGLKNSIRGNSIFANGGLGIDLGGDGVSPNDVGDGDAGPNGLQNFPVIGEAVRDGASVTVAGSAFGSIGAVLNLDFYWSETCDGTGYGEGMTYLGSQTVTTDSSGVAPFNSRFTAAVAEGGVVTATATSASGNTSEFAQCRPVSDFGSGRHFDGLEVHGLGGGTLTDTGGTLEISNVGSSGNDGLGLALGGSEGWRGEFRWPTVDSGGLQFTTTISGDSGSSTGQVLATTFYDAKDRSGSFMAEFFDTNSNAVRIELRDMDGLIIGAGPIDNATVLHFLADSSQGQTDAVLPKKLTAMTTGGSVSICLEFSEDVFIQDLPASVRQAKDHPGLRRIFLTGSFGRLIDAISSVAVRASLPPPQKGGTTGAFEIVRSEVFASGLFLHPGGANIDATKDPSTEAGLIIFLNPVPDSPAMASIDLAAARQCGFVWQPFNPADVPADAYLHLGFSGFTGGDKGGRNSPVGRLALKRKDGGLELTGAKDLWDGPLARVQVLRQGKVVFDGTRPLDQPLALLGSWPTGVEASLGDDSIYGILIGLLFPADQPVMIEVGGVKFGGDAIRISAGQPTATVRYLETSTIEFNLARIRFAGESMAPATIPQMDFGTDGGQSVLRIRTDVARRYRVMSSDDPAAAVWDSFSSFIGDGTTRTVDIVPTGEANAGRFFRVWAE
jgi:hypothetical protein